MIGSDGPRSTEHIASLRNEPNRFRLPMDAPRHSQYLHEACERQQQLGREGTCSLFGALRARIALKVDHDVHASHVGIEEDVANLMRQTDASAGAASTHALRKHDGRRLLCFHCDGLDSSAGQPTHQHSDAEFLLDELDHVAERLHRQRQGTPQLGGQGVPLLGRLRGRIDHRESAPRPEARLVTDQGPQRRECSRLRDRRIERLQIRGMKVLHPSVAKEDARRRPLSLLTTKERVCIEVQNAGDCRELRCRDAGLTALQERQVTRNQPDLRGKFLSCESASLSGLLHNLSDAAKHSELQYHGGRAKKSENFAPPRRDNRGNTEVYINHRLGLWQGQGLVRTRHGRIDLLDAGALARLAQA
jgi:hypothetical protein